MLMPSGQRSGGCLCWSAKRAVASAHSPRPASARPARNIGCAKKPASPFMASRRRAGFSRRFTPDQRGQTSFVDDLGAELARAVELGLADLLAGDQVRRALFDLVVHFAPRI